MPQKYHGITWNYAHMVPTWVLYGYGREIKMPMQAKAHMGLLNFCVFG